MIEILRVRGILSERELQLAAAEQQATGRPLDRILAERGLLTEQALLEAIAAAHGLPVVDVLNDVDPRAAELLAPQDAQRLGVLAVGVEGGTLLVAMPDVPTPAVVEELEMLTGRVVRPVLAARGQLIQAIARYGEATGVRNRGGAALDPSSSEGLARGEQGETRVTISELVEEVLVRNASDLHLTTGARPTIRVNGALTPLMDYPVLAPHEVREMLYSVLTDRQRQQLETNLELDCSHTVPGRARFRLNVYFQRSAIGAAFRLIPTEIKPLENLGIPPQVAMFSRLARGFVLVTGPTGSGKSTTLASLVDLANRERADHIMTVEDPIEFLHQHKRCLINQREVGEDTKSFAQALKHVLRQDPDIILVGELRDLETIQVALTAAETGHLVFATLHTQDAPQTIDRLIDVFPTTQQQQVRVMLAGSIQGVVCQQLIPRADGQGRMVATEVMVATPAIRNLIREGKTHQIYSSMQAGGRYGMQTMDQSLAELVRARTVGYEDALDRCHHVDEFNRLSGRAGL